MSYKVDRGLLLKEAKTDIPSHEIPFRIGTGGLGGVLDRFLALHSKIEQSLNWFRIVIAEDRYLEDKYFYSVRMIDALYRALDLKIEGDKSSVKPLQEISSILECSKREDLVEFVSKRVVPIFNRTSLSDRIRDLKARFAEIAVVRVLNDRAIAKLRGKEAHGSAEQFTTQEYKFMAFAFDLLTTLYSMLILEKCGLPRSFLLAKLKEIPKYSHYFSDQRAQLLLSEIGEL